MIKNNIMLIDKQTANDLRWQPLDDELEKKLEIIPFEKLEKEQNIVICVGNEKYLWKEILCKESNYILTRSFIYNNHYYATSNFENEYINSLRSLMHEMAAYMGAKKFHFEFIDESEYKNISDIITNVNIGGLVKGITGGIRANITSHTTEHYNQNNKESLSHDSKDGQTKPKTKEEFKEWIEREQINISALPSFFQTLVNMHLEQGEVHGRLKDTNVQKLNSEVIDSFNVAASFRLGQAMLPPTIRANFTSKQKSQETSNAKRYIQYIFDFG